MNKLKVWRRRTAAALSATALCMHSVAATDTASFEDPAKNLIELVLTLIKYGGILLGIWGLVQLFLAMNNHDSTQKMSGVWMVFGGIAMVFLKTLLNGIGITW